MADVTDFKPADHRFGPTHWFGDIEVGDKFYINSRTQTGALFAAFQSPAATTIRFTTIGYCRAGASRPACARSASRRPGAAGAVSFRMSSATP